MRIKTRIWTKSFFLPPNNSNNSNVFVRQPIYIQVPFFTIVSICFSLAVLMTPIRRMSFIRS